MGLFQKENFGKLISEKLSEYIKTYTGKDERAMVSEMTGVGIQTINYVAGRTNPVTENNAPAMLELMKLAVINCTNRIQHAKSAKVYLEKEIESCEAQPA